MHAQRPTFTKKNSVPYCKFILAHLKTFFYRFVDTNINSNLWHHFHYKNLNTLYMYIPRPVCYCFCIHSLILIFELILRKCVLNLFLKQLVFRINVLHNRALNYLVWKYYCLLLSFFRFVIFYYFSDNNFIDDAIVFFNE